jgi:hypothetical protein
MKGLIMLEVDVDSQEELQNLHNDILFSNEELDAGGYTSKEETISSIYEIMEESLGEKEE